MLTPFCTPLRSSYRHPATSLQPTPLWISRPASCPELRLQRPP